MGSRGPALRQGAVLLAGLVVVGALVAWWSRGSLQIGSGPGPAPALDPPVSAPGSDRRDALMVQVLGADATPLPGASVAVLPWAPEPDEDLPDALLVAHSDDRGWIHCANQTPAQRHTVRVTAPGHVPRVATVQIGRPTVLTLAVATTVRLTLRTAQGPPWPTAAEVWLEAEPGVYPRLLRRQVDHGQDCDFGPVPRGSALRLWVFTPGRTPDMFAIPAQGSDPVPLVLGETTALHFVVVDAHDGQAIAGATLYAGPGVELARSSAAGRCVVRAATGATHRIVCTAPGHAAVEFTHAVDAADQDRVFTLRLRRAATVAGVVADGLDRPVAGARITVLSTATRTELPEPAQPRLLPALAADTRLATDARARTAVSDAQGRFVLDGLTSAGGALALVLVAVRPGYAPGRSAELVLDADTRTVATRIQVRRAASIAGRVWFDGAPTRAEVAATCDATGDLATTLDDGSFHLAGVWPGEATVTATVLGVPGAHARIRASLVEGRNVLQTLTVPPPVPIPVHAQTILGTPLPGLSITAQATAGTRDGRVYVATTDAAGDCLLQVPQDPTCRYRIAASWGPFRRDAIRAAATPGSPLELRFPHMVPVPMQVVDEATGHAVADVTFRVESRILGEDDRNALLGVQHPGPWPGLTTTAGAVLAPLGEATLEVSARDRGYLPASVPVLVTQDPRPVQVRLVRGATVRLALEPWWTGGADALGLVPAARSGPRRPTPRIEFSTDARGLFAVGVPPGSWRLISRFEVQFTPEVLTVTGSGEIPFPVTWIQRR